MPWWCADFFELQVGDLDKMRQDATGVSTAPDWLSAM